MSQVKLRLSADTLADRLAHPCIHDGMNTTLADMMSGNGIDTKLFNKYIEDVLASNNIKQAQLATLLGYNNRQGFNNKIQQVIKNGNLNIAQSLIQEITDLEISN